MKPCPRLPLLPRWCWAAKNEACRGARISFCEISADAAGALCRRRRTRDRKLRMLGGRAPTRTARDWGGRLGCGPVGRGRDYIVTFEVEERRRRRPSQRG